MAAPDELLAYERVNFALAGRVELDRQGRVLIADKMLKRAQLTEQVMMVGVRDHLELWDVEQWGRFVNEHLAMHEQKLLEARAETLRQEREKIW
jgi:MraZ protein